MLAILLALVPAPQATAPELSIVGIWKMEWGACRQDCFFSRGDDYNSPQFGGGKYSVSANEDGSITVLFQERTGWWTMTLDANGVGRGVHVWWDSEGRARFHEAGIVNVRIFRIDAERLPMPRGEP